VETTKSLLKFPKEIFLLATFHLHSKIYKKEKKNLKINLKKQKKEKAF